MKPRLIGNKCGLQNLLFIGSNCVSKPRAILHTLAVVPLLSGRVVTFFRDANENANANANASSQHYMCAVTRGARLLRSTFWTALACMTNGSPSFRFLAKVVEIAYAYFYSGHRPANKSV
jgi:hypothetical protein